MNTRFVALGDSFTEGVGDADPGLPNGVRGWADLVAARLAQLAPDTSYANLAVRSKQLGQIVGEQVDAAVAMEPTLVTLCAGGNDLLHARVDLGALAAQFEDTVARLSAGGARMLLFTSFDAPLSAGLAPLRARNQSYNRHIRAIASRHRALLVDSWCFEQFQDWRLWSADRLHMSTAGHLYLAAKVLEVLRVPHALDDAVAAALEGAERGASGWRGAADGATWLYRDVRPWLVRRARGRTSGDGLSARWPVLGPVDPRLTTGFAGLSAPAARVAPAAVPETAVTPAAVPVPAAALLRPVVAGQA
ncbi:SGNH/GDSL hydrolase family protein [Paenarthrobacter sp. DKR-5]|uniref:SGNH/GDSL hydrolase family protein n=1 Tax=Paenarthrobacter sp. DKR-5 TaxID=2835535 RepID=UPI0027DC64BC|nr:SGNH/GDSL hydrolase family protein [Paenarthrobacter sp. DKR-5]